MKDAKYLADKPDELLDLVDENDQVIGTVLRGPANRNPAFTHREVAILLVNDNNQLLWEKRSQYKEVHPGWWSIPAGHVEAGADPLQTAHQELQEELCFDTELTFWRKQRIVYKNESHFMYFFIGQYTGQAITLELTEVAKAAFYTPTAMKKVAINEPVNEKYIPISQEFLDSQL